MRRAPLPRRSAPLFLSLFMTGCGLLGGAPESDGTIARVGGEIRVLDEAEVKEVCETHACEPNYIYSASFGRKRRQPEPEPWPPTAPVPIFPPAPAPRPVPAPPAGPSGDSLDYSKAILKLADAWKTTQGSREIVVAVIDTGVDVFHPDLQRNIRLNERELAGRPGFDDDGNGYPDDVFGWDFYHHRPNAIDDNRHGTHVAGIIGAELNGFGTAGAAPVVRILPVKFLGPDGGGDAAAAIRAIDYAVDNGARIISNSWGGGGRSELLNQAIQRAISRGIIVLAAAGNEANDNDARESYPANYDGVISVASTDESDALSPFSNYGKSTVQVAAPGSRIYSTVPGGGWDFLSGTSMATPQVSGALALALSVNGAIDTAGASELLCASSVRILTDRVRCGRIDAAELVRQAAHF